MSNISIPKSDKATRIALQKLSSRLSWSSIPTFANVRLTNLTANSLVYPDSTGLFNSLGVATNGQLPIGSTGTTPVLATLTGTTNQVNVVNAAGSITLSLPQDYDTGATPTLGGLTIVNAITEFSTDGTLGDDSDSALPTEKAVKAYVDGITGPGGHTHDTDTLQLDAINSDGGAFAFTTTGDITFKKNLIIDIDDVDSTGSIIIKTVGGTGTDAFITFIADETEANCTYSIGADDTGESFRISESAALGTTDRVIIYPTTGSIYLDSIAFSDEGTNCIRIGSGTDNNITGTRNLQIGYRAGYNLVFGGGGNSNGDDCTYIGPYSGYGASGSDNTGSENVGLGSYTLYGLTSGYENTCLGDEAGKWITSGHGNVAIGNDAMEGNGEDDITGSFNTAVGTDTLRIISTGGYNVAVGYQCGYLITDGEYNTLIGYQAGYNIAGLNNIVAIGYQALHEVVDNEIGNVAIGYQAGYYINQTAGTEGEDNTYIGENAGKGTGTTNVGAYNIGIGKSALTAIQSGNSNIVLGANTGTAITTGSNNFCVGQDAGYNLSTGSNNVYFGYQAGYKQTTASNDLCIGYQAGYNNAGDTTIGNNIFIGYQSFYGDNGNYNIGIGYQVGYTNDSHSGGAPRGDYNIYIGYQAGYGSGTNYGRYGVAIGYHALQNVSDGSWNTAIGMESLNRCTTGDSNTGIGYGSLYWVSTGLSNTAIGPLALLDLRTTSYNLAAGGNAGFYQRGTASSFIGFESGKGVNNQTVTDYSVFIGYQSGYGITSGDYDTCIGSESGRTLTTGASNVLIGYKAGYNQTTNSNLLIIDNQDRTNITNEANQAILYGVMAATPEAQTLAINAATTIGNVEDGHYTQVEADGTIEFNGDATVWNDANVGAMALTLPVANQPDEANFLDEGGGDTGITTWAYAIGEKSSGAIEIPHDYKEGSDIYFHIHWQGIAAPADGTDNVNWQLTYTVAQKDETLDAATTITKEIAIDTQYDFKLSDFAAITGTNFNIGDQFLFTIERIAASVDDYAGDVLIATVGLHYECDTCGSRQITTK